MMFIIYVYNFKVDVDCLDFLIIGSLLFYLFDDLFVKVIFNFFNFFLIDFLYKQYGYNFGKFRFFIFIVYYVQLMYF